MTWELPDAYADGPLMTTADRHRQEELDRRIDGEELCPHGRIPGVSNYDVWFCGACEREAETAHYDEVAVPALAAAPAAPARTADDLPF